MGGLLPAAAAAATTIADGSNTPRSLMLLALSLNTPQSLRHPNNEGTVGRDTPLIERDEAVYVRQLQSVDVTVAVTG